jgi:cobalt-precorrin 5A hydrolase
MVKKHTGSRGVAEPAALLAANTSELTITKQKYTEDGVNRFMTFAAARIPHAPRAPRLQGMETPNGRTL